MRMRRIDQLEIKKAFAMNLAVRGDFKVSVSDTVITDMPLAHVKRGKRQYLSGPSSAGLSAFTRGQPADLIFNKCLFLRENRKSDKVH